LIWCETFLTFSHLQPILQNLYTCNLQFWNHIHNTSLSFQLMNGPNKLECFFLTDFSSMFGSKASANLSDAPSGALP